MKGEETAASVLTDDERRARLGQVFGHRLSHPGKLHLPTTALYDTLTTDEGLKKLFFEFCRWLGSKPGRIEVRFDRDTATYAVNGNHITVSQTFQTHPYAAGALLAFAAVTYYMNKHTEGIVDQAEVELGTVETGLGLWVVNGLRPKLSGRQKLYHLLDSSWMHLEGISLVNYSTIQYAHTVADFAQRHRILIEEYITHVSRQRRHLLPANVSSSGLPSLPDPTVTYRHNRAARHFWFKLLLITAITATVACVGVYLWASRTPTVTAQQLEDKKALEIMKTSYEACVLKATGQQNTYDPNDLFLERQIDATKSRCESLRNEYNYALDQYEVLYGN